MPPKPKNRSVETLRVNLAEPERAARAITLGRLHVKLAELEARKKDAAKQMGADIATVEATIRETAIVVNQGYEFREVECELRFDREARTAQTIRLDTGEIVRQRPMSESELQRELI